MSSPSRRMASVMVLNAMSQVDEPPPEVSDGLLLESEELPALSGDFARMGEEMGESGREESPTTFRTGPKAPLGDVMVAIE